MKIIKTSERHKAKLSMVLLDWSVRESFHLLHYLQQQTASRDEFEVIVVEYYDRISDTLKPFEDQVDTWVLLEMPTECYYHKHLMYNTGIALSRGSIIMIGDADAMVRETFVETIINAFSQDPKIVYHIDQFRNIRRDLYPFNYPSFDEVLGDGCINNMGGKTAGILDEDDPMHSRNYGACMCARKNDLIIIGGADEHINYLGHVCGPYDMTFRLMNYGSRLVWETEEYMYHTWHPGSDGGDNFIGPHDGKNMSTTAFQAFLTGRVKPLVKNKVIHWLQKSGSIQQPINERIIANLIDPAYAEAFRKSSRKLFGHQSISTTKYKEGLYATYKGFDVYLLEGTFNGVPSHLVDVDLSDRKWYEATAILKASSFGDLKNIIDKWEAQLLETIETFNIVYVNNAYAVVPQSIGTVNFFDECQRNQPGILWKESLEEARIAAGNRGENPDITDRKQQMYSERISRVPRYGMNLRKIIQRLMMR